MDVASLLFTRAALSGLWIGPVIVVVASFGFVSRLHSRASISLLVGALGTFIASLGNAGAGIWFQLQMFGVTQSPGEATRSLERLAQLQGRVELPLTILSVAFGLTFAVSLLLVVRSLPDRRDTALQAPVAPV